MLQEVSSRCCSFVDSVWLLCRTAAGRCGSANLHNSTGLGPSCSCVFFLSVWLMDGFQTDICDSSTSVASVCSFNS